MARVTCACPELTVRPVSLRRLASGEGANRASAVSLLPARQADASAGELVRERRRMLTGSCRRDASDIAAALLPPRSVRFTRSWGGVHSARAIADVPQCRCRVVRRSMDAADGCVCVRSVQSESAPHWPLDVARCWSACRRRGHAVCLESYGFSNGVVCGELCCLENHS